MLTEFSKTAKGNQRDDALRDWSNDQVSERLNSLKGQLSAEERAEKQRLTREQKARGDRNKQKRGK